MVPNGKRELKQSRTQLPEIHYRITASRPVFYSPDKPSMVNAARLGDRPGKTYEHRATEGFGVEPGVSSAVESVWGRDIVALLTREALRRPHRPSKADVVG